MGCLLWGFERKVTALNRHRAVILFFFTEAAILLDYEFSQCIFEYVDFVTLLSVNAIWRVAGELFIQISFILHIYNIYMYIYIIYIFN